MNAIHRAVMDLAPGRNFSILEGGTVRFDDGEAPVTQEQIEAHAASLALQLAEQQVRQQRQAAYAAEADPLYFKWQRGEATEQEWLHKITEIRARYPKPDGSDWLYRLGEEER